MFNSVMNAFAFSIGPPTSEVTTPLSVAAWAPRRDDRESDRTITATTNASAREEYRHFMLTSDRWDSPIGQGQNTACWDEQAATGRYRSRSCYELTRAARDAPHPNRADWHQMTRSEAPGGCRAREAKRLAVHRQL